MLGRSLAVIALLLPLCLFAQLTRALPLLFAAAPAWSETLSLSFASLALLALALAPPALAVASAVTAADLVERGAQRALASHGAHPGWVAGRLRAVALGGAVTVAALGVFAEPALSWQARAALRALAARAVVGTLRRGGEMEPVPGVVIAAPEGSRGGLYVAIVGAGARTLARASGFEVEAGEDLTLTLRDVFIERGEATARAGRVVWTVPLAGPDEALVSVELAASIGRGGARAHRRHAARVLWGALGYTAVLLPARVAASPRLRGAWRAAVGVAVGLGVMLALGRAQQAWVEALSARGAIATVAACGALTALLAGELAAWRH